MPNGHNEATRLIGVIDKLVEQRTKSAANIEVTYGQVFELSGETCSVYLAGSRELAESDGGVPEPSEGFRVPAWLTINPGDFVRVAMDTRGHRWIEEYLLPLSEVLDIPTGGMLGSLDAIPGSMIPGGGDSQSTSSGYPKLVLDLANGEIGFGTGTAPLDTFFGRDDVIGLAGGIAIEDEGVPLPTGATTLDFTGAGVTVTGTGTEKTVDIPGGTSAEIIVEDEGTPLATAAETLNFTGGGVAASGAGAEKTINIPGVTVKDEGSALSTAASSIDFVGAGVTATGSGVDKTVTIPGSSLTVKDEGSALTTAATEIDFVGAGVTASGAGATKTVTIPGGSGGLVYPLDAAALHPTYGDEFTASPLDTKWSVRGTRVGSVASGAGGGLSSAFIPGHGAINWTAIEQPWTPTTEADIVSSISQTSYNGTIHTEGIFIVNSSGTGICLQVTNNTTVYGINAVTTWAFGGGVRTIAGFYNENDFFRGQQRLWFRLSKRSDIYFASLSADGENWSWYTHGYENSFTPAYIGVGKLSGGLTAHDIWVPRFNVENDFSIGNNLVRTPTSGTATYTASSQFSGSFTAGHAADGTLTDGWAASGNSDNPFYWQVAWSVGQTLNRVRLKARPGNASLLVAHILFNDGTTVPIPYRLTDSGLWDEVSFPTKTGVTSMRILADITPDSNAGFSEVEAYLAS